MTDTGQVPGEGHPDNAGMVDQQGVPAPVPQMPPLPPMPPAGYAFQDLVDDPAEDEELLLMPSGHGQGGAWSDPQVVPQAPAFPGEFPAEQGYTEYPQAEYAQAQAQPQAAGYPEPGHPGFPEPGFAMPGQQSVPGQEPVPGQQVVPGQPMPGQPPAGGSVQDPSLAGQAAQDHSLAGQPLPGQPLGFPDGTFPDPAAPEGFADPAAYSAGAHEAGGRDSGSLDLGGLVVPPAAAAAPGQMPLAAPVTPSRRPLHMGPPVPDATGGVVRSLADRGPAAAPAAAAAPPMPAAPAAAVPTGAPAVAVPTGAPAVAVVPAPAAEAAPETAGPDAAAAEGAAAPETPPGAEPLGAAEPPAAAAVPGTPGAPEPVPGAAPGAPAAGPEYLDVPGAEAAVAPVAPAAPQPGEIPPQAGAPWAAEPAGAGAEQVAPGGVEGQPVNEGQTAVDAQPVAAVDAQPVAEVQPVAEAQAAPAEGAPAADGQAASAEAPQAGPMTTEAGPAPEGAVATEPAAGPEGVTAPAPEAVPAPVAEAAPAVEGAPAPAEAAQPAEGVETPAEPAAEAPAEASPAEPVAQAADVPAETPAAPAETPAEPADPAAVADVPAEPAPDSAEAAQPVAADAEPAPADGEAAAEVPAEPQPSPGEPAPGYADAEREAVLRVMRERRDIRNGFRTDPIPHEVLLRVLEAAHHAPSVGHSQPWDFVVIRSAETRRTMHELAQRQREAYAKSLPKGRAKQFKELKIEAILDTPVNIVVTADPTRGGRHTLGRHTQPQMAPYSSALAVENLWLAARAEGLGVGWVSFFDEREMVRALGLPEHLEVVAYLCVGYVDEFPEEPELMQAGWAQRRPLAWVVHEETYGRRALPGEAPHDLLSDTVASIRPLDAKALGEAWERQKRMTKPAGALGMLEIISAQLAGLSRVCPPPIPEPAAVAIFAGDHGVHAQGVTPWPQEVTTQMVANFLGGGAVCNAFANQVGAEVCVVDVGVKGDLPATPGLLPRKVRPGTDDLSAGPAMSREDAIAAIEVGIETARDLVAAGNKGLLTGEMGIANTTVSAALISVFTGVDPAEVTGRGTGINDETHARKVDVVRRALELHQPDVNDPIGVLAAIGGLEHAAIVGLILGGASLRTPVILDGVSAGAAALVARAIAPEALSACIAGHRSAEPGHVAALNKLGLRPLVDLDLRLGEGTGALLALPLVQSAARAMHEVATFDSAGVTEK